MKSRPSIPAIKSFEYVLTFGKHKGKKVEDIIELDPGYILWIDENKLAKIDEEILNVAEEADRNEDWGEIDMYDWMDEPF